MDEFEYKISFDYNYSGLSILEAMEDSKRRAENELVRRHVPRFIAKRLAKMFKMQIACDGCPRTTPVTVVGKPMEDERWVGTEWIHRSDLDFCPACQSDGSMDKAIAEGKRPRGRLVIK